MDGWASELIKKLGSFVGYVALKLTERSLSVLKTSVDRHPIRNYNLPANLNMYVYCIRLKLLSKCGYCLTKFLKNVNEIRAISKQTRKYFTTSIFRLKPLQIDNFIQFYSKNSYI